MLGSFRLIERTDYNLSFFSLLLRPLWVWHSVWSEREQPKLLPLSPGTRFLTSFGDFQPLTGVDFRSILYPWRQGVVVPLIKTVIDSFVTLSRGTKVPEVFPYVEVDVELKSRHSWYGLKTGYLDTLLFDIIEFSTSTPVKITVVSFYSCGSNKNCKVVQLKQVL